MRFFICFFLISVSYVSAQKTHADENNNIVSKNGSHIATRIIALSPSSVEQLFAIGAGDRIIATLEYADYPLEAKKIQRVGNYRGVQIEKVLKLKPDLVIAWGGGNKSSDIDKLRDLGIDVYQSESATSIDQISNQLRELGKRTGLEENASKVIAQIEQRYKRIKTQYANKIKTKVFYQLWHNPLTTVGPSSWIDSLISDCNGKNIFSDVSSAYPQVSIESVLVKNPQVIIIAHHSGSDPEVSLESFNWDQWLEIDAVKANHIYSLNGDLLHRFTPRALDGLELLCQTIDKVRKSEGLD